MTSEPDERDRAVHATLLAALRPFGDDVADVGLEWNEHAHLWFTEVTPHAAGAAALGVAAEDGERLLVTVGATTAELDGLSDPLQWLTTVATAVFAGRSLEAGRSGAHARILCEDGSVVTFRRSLPWPGMWRAATRHAPYGLRATDRLRGLGTFLRDRSGEVDTFRDVDQVQSHVEWPDVSDGDCTDALTIDGHVLELVATPDERVLVRVTETVDPARLRALAEAAAVQAGLPADLDPASVWRATLPARRR